MKQGKKISDLIQRSKKHTKDYKALNYIFNLYLSEKYETMGKEIYFYKDREFERDIWVYLDNNFSGDLFKSFFFRDIMEIYIDDYDCMLARLSSKKKSKDYLNKWIKT